MSNFLKEALCAPPRITIMSDEEIQIENSRGICEFNEHNITVRTTIGGVAISGERLAIASVETDSVTIFGKITAVSYI